ncbi:cilia- and flagella-associated protein 251-like [Hyla sarda]|uniref:cilia- and flagella-associated protein 251-like n=1 Tax=Hyla sarda TaxID=327740 RepID=UPI0024C212C3|nr:cilia- and flagella-associated protein 251-like [Hyla sarda]XP_056391945.1 cilia- and flagella-associated protein 251-like [Hyla sarda]XP_056391946.1 cilia- and flagella-associated protein 251-like [Hyla sarda]
MERHTFERTPHYDYTDDEIYEMTEAIDIILAFQEENREQGLRITQYYDQLNMEDCEDDDGPIYMKIDDGIYLESDEEEEEKKEKENKEEEEEKEEDEGEKKEEEEKEKKKKYEEEKEDEDEKQDEGDSEEKKEEKEEEKERKEKEQVEKNEGQKEAEEEVKKEKDEKVIEEEEEVTCCTWFCTPTRAFISSVTNFFFTFTTKCGGLP